MARKINVAGLSIYVNVAACAHNCRYCSTGKKKVSDLPLDRLTGLIERFGIWRERKASANFAIDIGIGHAPNYDIELLIEIERLRKAVGNSGGGLRTIHLGGLQKKSELELYRWLKERRDRAGVEEVHASLAGSGSVHDYWNRRDGDFDYLMLAMRTAADLGLRIRQRLFVIRSTLPYLDALIEKLDTIPGGADRYYNLFYYKGLAAELEDERITEEQRQQLPPYIHRDDPNSRNWRSERKWIAILDDTREPLRNIFLKLPVTSSNIDELEATSCTSIVDTLVARTERAYSSIPARAELLRCHGNRESALVYKDAEDMENKWLDLYQKGRNVRFERHLTHLNIQFDR